MNATFKVTKAGTTLEAFFSTRQRAEDHARAETKATDTTTWVEANLPGTESFWGKLIKFSSVYMQGHGQEVLSTTEGYDSTWYANAVRNRIAVLMSEAAELTVSAEEVGITGAEFSAAGNEEQ